MNNSSSKRPSWLWLAGIVISLAALALAVRKVEWGDFAEALRSVKPGWLLLGSGFVLVNFLFRALRWQALLGRFGRYRLMDDCLNNYMIGYMANMLFPLKAGEFIRPVLFGRKHGVSRTSVFTLVVAERLLDMIFLSVFFLSAVVLGMSGMQADVEQGVGWIAGASVVVFAGCALLSFHRPTQALLRRIAGALPGPLARLGGGLLDRVLSGLEGFMDGRSLARSFLHTIGLWSCAFVTLTCYLHAFDLALPWFAPVFVLVVVNFGMVVPSTPGAIGLAHGLFVFALALFDVDRSVSLGFAVVAHGIGFSLVTLIGLGCTWREGLRVRDLSGSDTEVLEPPQDV